MPVAIGGSRGFPTENQPLAPGYPAAAAPPTSAYAGGYAPASGQAGMATIGSGPVPSYAGAFGQAQAGNQAGMNGLLQGYQANPAQGGAGANIIGGTLPWNGAGGNMFQGLSGDPATTLANLGSNYQNAYNAALGMNQSNYNNILQGYQQTAQNQVAGQNATQAGYGNLSHDVLGGIAGIGSDQLALINRNYAGQAGAADQNLINSGLGNSTVRSSVQRGIGLDQSLAQNNLANSIAQTKAGFQSNLGLAGLGYQGQSVRDNTNLAQNQLGWMNSVNAGYPNAAMYGQLAQQAGAAIQSNANRAQIDRLAGQNNDLGAQVRQAAVLGGSGGMSPGTGGQLPPSIVRSAGAQSPGMGTSGFSGSYGGGSGGLSGGLGSAGGQYQNVRGGGGGGFGGGLAGAPGVTNLMGVGGGVSGLLGGAGMMVGSDSAYGGYDPGVNPFGFGGDFSSTPQGFWDSTQDELIQQQQDQQQQPQGYFDPFFGFDLNQTSMSGDMGFNGGNYYYG